jgi:hypothetical protein
VDFGTSSTYPHSVARVMVQEDVRVVDRTDATCTWRRNIGVRDLPPLLIACADLSPALAFEAMQVLPIGSAFQGDGVRVVAVLNGPLLLIAPIAFVLDDNAGGAAVLLMC